MSERKEKNMWRRGQTWWLRAIIGGVEHRQSLQCSDVKSARARRDILIAEIKEARWAGKRQSWKEAVAEYLEYAPSSDLGPRTIARYALSLRMIQPFLEQHDVAKIDGEVVNRLIAARRNQGAGNATIRRDLTAASQVWEHADLGEALVNPFIAKRKKAKERREPITLPDPGDVVIIIARCNPEMGAMMRAAWLTGCRLEELCTAEWRGFDPAGKLEIIGKGNKRRTIDLAAEAMAHIRAQPRAIEEGGAGLSPYIFRQQNAALASYYFATVTKRHAARAQKAGEPFRPFRFHDLRHLYAVTELRAGRGLYAIQQHLGHTSIAVTESVYLKHGGFLTADEAEKAKRAMG